MALLGICCCPAPLPDCALNRLRPARHTVPSHRSGATLVSDLTLSVVPGHSLLIMGPSGAGKTSILRSVAGLWNSGSGAIVRHGQPMGRAEGEVGGGGARALCILLHARPRRRGAGKT